MITCARGAACLARRRYQEFKAVLEGLDSKRQAHSPLPIIYQWQAPIAGAGTKCAPRWRPASARACPATAPWLSGFWLGRAMRVRGQPRRLPHQQPCGPARVPCLAGEARVWPRLALRPEARGVQI